jgi:hypothetical protein
MSVEPRRSSAKVVHVSEEESTKLPVIDWHKDSYGERSSHRAVSEIQLEEHGHVSSCYQIPPTSGMVTFS